KRVKEFRKRGEIALSRDLVSAATLLGGAIALIACSSMAAGKLLDLTREASAAADGRDVSALAHQALRTFGVVALPVMLGASGAAIVAILVQLGWPPAWKKLELDFGRMNPVTNLRNAFGLGAVTRRTGSALAKLTVVGAIVVVALRNGVANHALHAGGIGAIAWSLATRVLWLVVGALVAIAAVDYILARRRISAQMRMTADEVKREHRENDGDPLLKGKRKARMRELAKRRMAAAVSKADVVVVNPT